MKPIFAVGKTNECIETTTIGIGTTTIVVGSATNSFSVGDPIFVSENNDSEVEYLGEATAVDATTVTVTHATIAAKSSPFKIWKPTNSVKMPYGVATPWERSVPLGVQTQRTQAGTAYRTKVSDIYTLITLNWNDLPESDCTSLNTFIITTLNYGVNNCTIGYYDFSAGRIYSVIATLLMNDLSHYETFPEYTPISIQFQIVSADTYKS